MRCPVPIVVLMLRFGPLLNGRCCKLSHDRYFVQHRLNKFYDLFWRRITKCGPFILMLPILFSVSHGNAPLYSILNAPPNPPP